MNAVTAPASNSADADEAMNQNCNETDEDPRPPPEARGTVAGRPQASRWVGGGWWSGEQEGKRFGDIATLDIQSCILNAKRHLVILRNRAVKLASFLRP